MFGSILNRMIFGELVRVFVLALVALTGLFLLGGLVAEATHRGLAPSQVMLVIPLLIPSTLPFTIPATTLFATCVVYGRLAADNEVTAVKAAGVHLGRIIAPSVVLGLATGAVTMALYYDFIPRTHMMLRSQVLGDAEEFIYALLKRQGCIRDPRLKASIWVREVRGRYLIDVVYKQHDLKGEYTRVARAREAQIHFDAENNQLKVEMPTCFSEGADQTVAFLRDQPFTIDLPKNLFGADYRPRASDLTWKELRERLSELPEEVRQIRELANNPPPAPANFAPADVRRRNEAFQEMAKLKAREQATVEVELYQRPALAVGCLCFVLLGCPVGIWFSKSDYLSAFVTCFLPTLFVYYPLLLCGTNLAKEGRISPVAGMWAANVVAAVASVVMYSRLFKK
jgi:lipopolysaccharide export system permease protein